MTDLAQIHTAIGHLTAQVTTLANEQVLARQRDEKIFGKLEELRDAQVKAVHQNVDIRREQQQMDSRLKEVEGHVEDYKNVRRWGALVWAGTVAAAGAIGYAVELVSEWVRKA